MILDPQTSGDGDPSVVSGGSDIMPGEPIVEVLARLSPAERVAYALLSCGAVSFHLENPVTFKSGILSPIYLDNRVVLSYPEQRNMIVAELLRAIEEEIGTQNIDHIAGTATAAISMAAIISDRLNVAHGYARSENKGHGLGQKYEGRIKLGDNVLVVEDHVSTGGSSLGTVETARAEGGIVSFAIATTTYETEAARLSFEGAGVQLISLTNGRTIVETALKLAQYLPTEIRLTQEQVDVVKEWLDDPIGWSERRKEAMGQSEEN